MQKICPLYAMGEMIAKTIIHDDYARGERAVRRAHVRLVFRSREVLLHRRRGGVATQTACHRHPL